MNGLLIVDKPGGMTSRDAVNRVQRWFPQKTKIGHTGTLDPLATGVLVVCVGAATRLADYVQAMGKSYASRFRLGATSSSDDADGTVSHTADAGPPTREQVDAVLGGFVGTIGQVPPAVSALKVAGRRAHDLARKGEAVELAPRPVRIDAIRVAGYDWPFLDIEVDCGKGTYIRSIARDLGATLGCGGLVQTLRRTRVGPFTAGQGVGVDEPPADLGAVLRPMAEAVAEMPGVTLGDEAVKRFRQGQVVPASGGLTPSEAGPVAVFDGRGELIGIGSRAGAAVKADLVFNA